MKICSNCGTQMPDSARFCRKCGTGLENAVVLPDETTGKDLTGKPQAETVQTEAAQTETVPAEVEQAEPVREKPVREEPVKAADDPVQGYEAAPGMEDAAPAPAAEESRAGWVHRKSPAEEPPRKKQIEAFSQEDISGHKLFAMAAYLAGPIGVIIALLGGRDSAYTGFHARQALKLYLTEILCLLILMILYVILLFPIPVGLTITLLAVTAIVILLFLVLHIICFVNVCREKAVEVPIIGAFKFLK